jgi:hypothetical protein
MINVSVLFAIFIGVGFGLTLGWIIIFLCRIYIDRGGLNSYNPLGTVITVFDPSRIGFTINSGYEVREETNDCVVRSLMPAFDMSYPEAHDFAKRQLHRRDRRGVMSSRIERKFGKIISKNQKVNGKSLVKLCVKDRKLGGYISRFVLYEEVNMRSREFLNKPGTYLILVDGHAFTIKDGVLYDNDESPEWLDWRVMNVYQVNE